MIHATLGGLRGRRPRRAALAALALLALIAAACGGGSTAGGGGEKPDAGSTTTYTNDAYGFAITYDAVLTRSAPGATDGAAFTIAFVDTGGPKAGEAYADGVQVSVFELPRAVKESELRGLEPQVEALVAERIAKLPSGEVTEPLARTTVNGTPGFTVSYTFVRDGVTISAVSTFLFSEGYQYEVTGQASAADWEELGPTLEAVVGSFAVLSSS